MKYAISIALIFLILNLHAQQSHGVYKRYTGSINKKSEITMDLMISDTSVAGHYYYNSEGVQIELRGWKKNDTLQLTERSSGKITGAFTGKITGDLATIEGTWRDSSLTKSYKFILNSFLPPGSAEAQSLSKSYFYLLRKNNKGDSLGCRAEYTYLYITGLQNKQVQQAINETLLNTGVEEDDDAAGLQYDAGLSMSASFEDYVASYKEVFPDSVLEENEKYMDQSPYIYIWERQDKNNIVLNENYLLCTENLAYDYTGGAHGNYALTYSIVDLRTGELLQIENLFKASGIPALTALAEAELRRQYKIDSKSPLTGGGFFVKSLDLTDNIYITHSGIGFSYNPYEIAPYSNGVVNIFLTWGQVKSLIKEDGPLGWVISSK